MKMKAQKIWTLIALLCLLHWFFGNLYEQIVIAPNWISNSTVQLERLHAFFINTTPTNYFVPISQIGILIVWILFFTNQIKSIKKNMKIAAILGTVAMTTNIFIVTTIIMKVFAMDFHQYAKHLNMLCWRWNYLNIGRMTFTAMTVYHLFIAYCTLDKMEII